MVLSRRRFLRLSGLAALGAALSACGPPPLLEQAYSRLSPLPRPLNGWLPPGDADRFPILNRLTFGPRLEERRRAAEIGLQNWIEEQLAPETLDDRAADLRVRPLTTLTLSAGEIADLSDKLFDAYDRAGAPAQLRRATLLRQVYSRRQIYELMVEFWTDHFNISVDKGDGWFLKTVDDREVIRPHALGNFRDLLWASAHSPAMLIYLDNQANRAGTPNENYARELLELHTLGVDGGYSQRDVMELARCLTGWTVKDHFWRGEFVFRANLHDGGPKRVLGLSLQPEGQAEAERVLDRLAVHPGAARFIAHKLVRRFIADDPPPALVERAAATFTRSKGDIRAVLRTVLLDGLEEMQPKFKRPVHFVVSALRQLNAESDGGPFLHDFLRRMGQLAFAWPTPDGYPDRAAAWQGNLLPRWQFALALVQSEIGGTEIDLPNLMAAGGATDATAALDALAALLLGQPLLVPERDALLTTLQGIGAAEDLMVAAAAALLASPAFQWR